MPEMISIGECMIELFSEDPLETASTFTRSFAGDSFNILVAANRLGTSTGYITKLGNDPFKSYLENSFLAEGVDTSHVITSDSGGFNAAHFVAVMPNGEREFVYYRKGSAPSAIAPSDLNEHYITKAKVMHCSGIAQAISPSARNTVLRAAEIAHKNGVTVSYDPNYRHQLWNPDEARVAMEELMPFVDIFLPSSPADSVPLFGTEDPEDVIREAENRGVDITVVTMGEDGAIVSGRGETIRLDPEPAGIVVDTTGAGDAFKGGFIHGLIEGLTLEESALLGNISAGITITGRGALGTIPGRATVYRILETIQAK